LFSFMKTKAHDIDCYIKEFGAWREHVHLLVRTRPTVQLSEVYRQLKGFSSYSWRKSYPDKPFQWADGTYSLTVAPYNCEPLREYIRNQPRHHRDKNTVSIWETEDESE